MNDTAPRDPVAELTAVLRAVPGVAALYPARVRGAALEFTTDADGVRLRASLGVVSAAGAPGAAQVLRAAHAALLECCVRSGMPVQLIHLTVVHLSE